MISETDRITERVDFPFTFVQFGLHVRKVAHPFAAFGIHVESIGIRVDIDTLELTFDNAGQHFFQFRVFVGKLHVRPYLCTRIAQPHGVNVTRINKRIIFTVKMNSSIQCVRETVFEHPCQAGIRQQLLDMRNLLFHSLRDKQTFRCFRTVRLIVVDFGIILLDDKITVRYSLHIASTQECYGQTKGFSYIHGNSLFLLISIDYESVAEKKC